MKLHIQFKDDIKINYVTGREGGREGERDRGLRRERRNYNRG